MIFYNLLEGIFEKEILDHASNTDIKVLYVEHKQNNNMLIIESKIKHEGNIYNIEIFLNTEKEYYSSFSCTCMAYYKCKHLAATMLRFIRENEKLLSKYIIESKASTYYTYEINGNKLKVDYETKLRNWILGYEDWNEGLYEYFENMAQIERALAYKLRKNRSFSIESDIAKILTDLGMKKANRYVVKEDKRCIIGIENNKIKIQGKICDNKLNEYQNKNISAKFLFEDLPRFLDKNEVEVDDSINNYVLYQEDANFELKIKAVSGNIYIEPVISFEGKKYKNSEILSIDTDYKKIGEHEYRRINIKKYNNFIKLLKEDWLKFSQGSFICSKKKFQQKYTKLKKDWKISNIRSINIQKNIYLDLNRKNSQIKYNYSLGNEGKALDKKEISEIKNTCLLSKKDKVFFIENAHKIEDEDVYAGNLEEILCKYAAVKKEVNISYQDNIYDGINIREKHRKILRNYQVEGLKWLKFLYKFGFSGILADDMGLGKTIQTLFFVEEIKSKGKVLIIVPKTLMYNWEDEIKKFLKTDDYLVYDGNPKQRKNLHKKLEEKSIIISSYSLLNRDFEIISQYEFLYFIIDEAHHIKNSNTVTYKKVRKIKSKYRLALTGTPMENSLKEYCNIFEFLMPGYLSKDIYSNLSESAEYLKYKTAPFVMRRNKKNVLKELPDKIEQVIKVDLNYKQKKEYDSMLMDTKMKVYEQIKRNGLSKSYINILAYLTSLRQFCDHPILIGKPNLISSKLELMMEIVEEAVEGGHKILIFSQFVKMLEIIENEIIAKKIDYEKLTGQSKNRNEIVKRFNNQSRKKIFLISLKAGGVGLNISSADTVILFDPWWNPMIEKQAMDRAHRMGQKNIVNVYKLISKDTVEEKILEIQEKKYNIFEMIMEGKNAKNTKLTIEDIENLLTNTKVK